MSRKRGKQRQHKQASIRNRPALRSSTSSVTSRAHLQINAAPAAAVATACYVFVLSLRPETNHAMLFHPGRKGDPARPAACRGQNLEHSQKWMWPRAPRPKQSRFRAQPKKQNKHMAGRRAGRRTRNNNTEHEVTKATCENWRASSCATRVFAASLMPETPRPPIAANLCPSLPSLRRICPRRPWPLPHGYRPCGRGGRWLRRSALTLANLHGGLN